VAARRFNSRRMLAMAIGAVIRNRLADVLLVGLARRSAAVGLWVAVVRAHVSDSGLCEALVDGRGRVGKDR
jgi:hypothetical protein